MREMYIGSLLKLNITFSAYYTKIGKISSIGKTTSCGDDFKGSSPLFYPKLQLNIVLLA